MPAKGTHTPRAPISDPRDPHGWHGLTETFCEWMAVQNYSPKTVDNRRKAFEGALWILRTGAPWQDLPPRYGPYQTVHRRFQNWVRSGVNERVLLALAEHLQAAGGLDLQECFVNGTPASFCPPTARIGFELKRKAH